MAEGLFAHAAGGTLITRRKQNRQVQEDRRPDPSPDFPPGVEADRAHHLITDPATQASSSARLCAFIQ
jgi:hypothetical protein